jgi:hypothetical protein
MIKTFRPASDAQARFITTLLADRAVPEALATATAEALASGTLSVGEASEAITLLKQLPRDWDKALCRPTSGGKPAAPAPTVAAGHYAVADADGVLKFYRVDCPTGGRWAGYTFVKVQASDDFFAVRGEAARAVLAAIAGDSDAGPRYGREIGRCYRCNRTLTDAVSRSLGIGPDCRSKI